MRCAAVVLLFFLIFIIYSNTFRASWHLDDYHAIVKNPRLKITHLQPDAIVQTFFSSHDQGLYLGNKIYRPIPCLTFALNWYFGNDQVFGYHLVNICIHFLTACILYLAILNLLKSPNLSPKYQDSRYFIALLSAVLWAANPIQTQAVTYIVQRMASMAAMFYVLGIYLYLRGRLSRVRYEKVFCYLGSVLSYAFAVASKENAIIFPFALLLVEIIFFQDLRRRQIRKVFFWAALAGGILFIFCGAIFVFYDGPLTPLKLYENRFFTPLQRLMTEPRILMYYLSQIFYPTPNRLSIEHDISISTSLIHPWTTLPSLIIVLLLIGIGFSQMRKRPILGFAILFFFLNHIIESSVIGLELFFEHRNYLPSMFLFLPIALSLKWLLDYYRKQKRAMYFVLVSFVTLLIMGFGIGTFIRNMAWGTEESLWKDAIRKAPESGRACHNLAWGYFELTGQSDKALRLYPKCLELKAHSKLHKSLIWDNIASIYFQRQDYKNAAQYWQAALAVAPQVEFLRYRLAMALGEALEFDEALSHLDDLLSKRPEHTDYILLKGSVLLEQKKYREALSFFQKALRQRPYSTEVMMKLGMVFNLMEDYHRAEMFFRNAHSRDLKEPFTLLWLVATNLKLEDAQDTERYLNKLFELVPVNKVQLLLETVSNPDDIISSQRDLLFPVITRKLRQRLEVK